MFSIVADHHVQNHSLLIMLASILDGPNDLYPYHVQANNSPIKLYIVVCYSFNYQVMYIFTSDRVHKMYSMSIPPTITSKREGICLTVLRELLSNGSYDG